MDDIRNFKVGDIFYHVYGYWWNREMLVTETHFDTERPYIGAICKKSGNLEWYDNADLVEFYADKQTAGKVYRTAIQSRLNTLSDIPYLLDSLYEYCDETDTIDAAIYRKAIRSAKARLKQSPINEDLEDDLFSSATIQISPSIQSGDRTGYLTAKWCWKNKKDYVWKCTCRCGKICYVKERAFLQRIITDCGCGTYRKY